jgi:hypothetical protein
MGGSVSVFLNVADFKGIRVGQQFAEGQPQPGNFSVAPIVCFGTSLGVKSSSQQITGQLE